MNWGCCEQPNNTWHFEGDTAHLICNNCGQNWVPANTLGIQPEAVSQASINGEFNIQPVIMAQDPHYQMAWQTLLGRIDQKSSWGKNLLKDLMLDCLTNPSPIAEPEPEPMPGDVEVTAGLPSGGPDGLNLE